MRALNFSIFVVLFGASVLSINKQKEGNALASIAGEKFGADINRLKNPILPTPNFSPIKEKDSSEFSEEELQNMYFWPTESFDITDSFGGARDHKGIDIRGRSEDWKFYSVFTIDDGIVVSIRRGLRYGLYVDIFHHGDSIYTRYAHLSKVEPFVKKGTTLYKGMKFANCGNSGRSTGPHLHFEIFVKENGKELVCDPLQVFIPDYGLEKSGGKIRYCISPLGPKVKHLAKKTRAEESRMLAKKMFDESPLGMAFSEVLAEKKENVQ